MNAEVCKDSLSWDAYVASMPEASNYHRWGWGEVIEETFGHKTHYIATTQNGQINGVLPLVRMKSRLFGHFMVSLPFFSYGGLVASGPDVQEALLSRAADLAHELGVSHIELRQAQAQ